jgi:hypothetical protein
MGAQNMRFWPKIFVPAAIGAARRDGGTPLMAHRLTRAHPLFDKICRGRRDASRERSIKLGAVFHGVALSHGHNNDDVVTDDPFAIGLWCASTANQWAFSSQPVRRHDSSYTDQPAVAQPPSSAVSSGSMLIRNALYVTALTAFFVALVALAVNALSA